MNLKRLVTVAVVSACWPVFAPTAFADFADIQVCPLEEAMKRLEDYNITLNAQLAEKQIPVLEEIQAINSKAKNPSLPVGAQLAKPDLDRFQQLREQLLAAQAQQVVNSGYLRDSRVIAQAAKVAYDLSVGRMFDEKDPQFFYYGVVLLLSVQHPRDQVDITTPHDKECSIEAGLHFNEQIAFREMNRVPVKETTDRLKSIAQRYGLNTKEESWVEKIPSLQDKQSAKIDLGMIEKGGRVLEYIKNLENLKALARASVLGYQSDMEDLKGAHTEQEISKVGTGWSERAKKYDERTQILSGVLNMIAQKIPSDAAIEAQGRTKMLQQQGIIR